jgi:hypothetical protein
MKTSRNGCRENARTRRVYGARSIVLFRQLGGVRYPDAPRPECRNAQVQKSPPFPIGASCRIEAAAFARSVFS